MAFSAKDHKIAEKGGISSNGDSTLDSSHNPGNNVFTYASLFQNIKNQKRTTFNIVPAIDNNASTTGRPLDYNSTFDMNCCFDSTSQRYNRQTGKPKSFIEFLNIHFSDCLNQPNLPHDYTFRRGSSLSTLDYTFAGRNAFFKMSDDNITFFSQEWTDHALLTKTYTTGMTNCGKGVWRANPFLAKNPIYVNKLNTAISNYVETKLDPNLSAQEKWDLIKKKTKQVTQSFSRTHCSWRKAKIKKLQSERNNLLRRYRDDSVCLNLLLSPVEKELSKI
ncbi:uncharacterized protein ATC70_009169 [Mucor velutinosus]|uniref:Uncharacterized protein n=1 Tax=Mucor velutinosus TaxID=708070 RepID=A0AAN7DK63_9FUNG|nr:hypothetical protein ATC70_009169 [Mucor velutinosus]